MRSIARSLVPIRRERKEEIPVPAPVPALPPLPKYCDDFDITSNFVPHGEVPRRRHKPIEPIELDMEEIRKRHMRLTKFHQDIPPPPVPKRKMAWLGGKISSNRKEATRRFIERCGDTLTPEQRAAALKTLDEYSSAASSTSDEEKDATTSK